MAYQLLVPREGWKVCVYDDPPSSAHVQARSKLLPNSVSLVPVSTNYTSEQDSLCFYTASLSVAALGWVLTHMVHSVDWWEGRQHHPPPAQNLLRSLMNPKENHEPPSHILHS